jgi:hypothetical protein
MRDAALKNRVAGIVIVQMHRVPICRDFGKKFDVPVGYGFAQVTDHADFKVFDTDGATRHIVEHPANPWAVG